MRPYRTLGLVAAAGIAAGAALLHAQQQQPATAAPLSVLAAQDEEYQKLYSQVNNSVVRVTVEQSALAVVKKEGLGDKFDAWVKANSDQGRAGRGRGTGLGGGEGRAATGGATAGSTRPDGNNPSGGGGFGRGGGGPGGGFGGFGGFGGRGGGGSVSSQVRNFLVNEADAAQKAGNADQAARLRGLALRVQVNPGGFQGDMLAAVLDAEGHALLLGGVFKEAQLPPESMKVVAPDGTQSEATYVGANLYAGYTVIKLSNLKGVSPTAWSKRKMALGQTLLPVTSGQAFVGAVHVLARFGEPFSEDRLPADEQSNPRFERFGAFLFDMEGRLAAVVTTGGGWAGERFALSGTRLQREIGYILKEGKDIEPRALGVSFTAPAAPDEPPPRATKAVRDAYETAKKAWEANSKVIGERRAVQVSDVTKNSLAADAKLVKGDLLLSIDGRPISEMVGTDGRALSGLIQMQVDLATRTGSVPVVIVREGKEMALEMVLK